MPASFLLDSNVLIYVLDQRSAVISLLHRLNDLEESERPAVSGMTVYEVLTGADAAEQKRTIDLLSVFEIIPVTESIAARAAALAQWQRAKGWKVGVADTLIAATALASRRVLVTYDVAHFQRLGVELYAELPPLSPDQVV